MHWPDVTDAHSDGMRLEIVTDTPETVLRRLLAEDATLHELEVERAGLTDAFLRLSDNASSSPQQHNEAA